jgi:menaquinone-dependent protoporphyrinogen oxidase
MEKGGRILVTYGAWGGSTRDVAAAIGEALATDRLSVDVEPASDVADLAGYRAVVLGTPLQAGRLHHDVYGFVERHRAALDDIPVAVFAVCLARKANTPENRRSVEAALAELWEKHPEAKPIDVGLFGCAARPREVALQRLPFARRIRHRHMKREAGRYSDWDDVTAWAGRVRDELVGSPQGSG